MDAGAADRGARREDGRWAAEVFAVTAAGTFEQTAPRCCSCRSTPMTVAARPGVGRRCGAARRRPQPGARRQGRHRLERPGHHRACRGGVALDDPRLARRRPALRGRLLELHLVDGRLRRASLGGRVGDSAGGPGGLRRAGDRTARRCTSSAARRPGSMRALGLLDTALDHFADPDRPGRWFDTADDAEALMVRPGDPLDGATPSGASSIAEALLTASLVGGGAARSATARPPPTPWGRTRRCWRGRRGRRGTGWPWPRPPCAVRCRSRWRCHGPGLRAARRRRAGWHRADRSSSAERSNPGTARRA